MFYKLRCALARFMYGRNGVDQLGMATLWGYLLIALIRAVFAGAGQGTPARLCEAVSVFLALVLLFRIFSKNLSRRRAENQKWLNWIWGIRSRFSGARARHADKEHKYFTCKSCKTICRVPAGKGRIVITCPKCGAQIRGKS